MLSSLMKTINKAMNQYQQDVVEDLERKVKVKERLAVKDDFRAHLRGITRTIPSFIMAYGDRNLTLVYFDTYTPAKFSVALIMT